MFTLGFVCRMGSLIGTGLRRYHVLEDTLTIASEDGTSVSTESDVAEVASIGDMVAHSPPRGYPSILQSAPPPAVEVIMS